MERTERIKSILSKEFQPSYLEVIDESHLHRGHVGAQSGGGHFNVIIVSEKFKNLNSIAKHRIINQALKELYATEIHALSIKASDSYDRL